MSTYPTDEDKRAVAWTICLILAACAACLALTGCGEARSQPPVPPPTVADEIRAIGYAFLRYGGLVLGLGMVVRAVLWAAGIFTFSGFAGVAVAWVAKYLAPFVGLGAVCGGAAVAFGACCVWMADYLWAVIGAGIVASVAVVWYYWPRLWRWVRARLHARAQGK
jgi:hypothetical protein